MNESGKQISKTPTRRRWNFDFATTTSLKDCHFETSILVPDIQANKMGSPYRAKHERES